MLRDLPVPALSAEQLQWFTVNSMRARRVRPFDARELLGALRAGHGQTIISIDINGVELTAAYFSERDGAVERIGDIVAYQDDDGVSYLRALRQLGVLARREGLRVGVSVAGQVNGTRLLAAPNVPQFAMHFQRAYGCDFAALFDAPEVANDAEAGIIACALEAARRFPDDARDVIYVINRSGLGGAVLTGGWIYAAEPGHVRVADHLNTFGQRKECGIDGARYACVEVVAGKAGIEDIWLQRNRRHQPGAEISALYQSGNRLARDIYDASARLTAHVILGMVEAFGLVAESVSPVVIGNGSVFDVPGYGERVIDILDCDVSPTPRFLFGRDFSRNTCLEGAAVAAATTGSRQRA